MSCLKGEKVEEGHDIFTNCLAYLGIRVETEDFLAKKF